MHKTGMREVQEEGAQQELLPKLERGQYSDPGALERKSYTQERRAKRKSMDQGGSPHTHPQRKRHTQTTQTEHKQGNSGPEQKIIGPEAEVDYRDEQELNHIEPTNRGLATPEEAEAWVLHAGMKVKRTRHQQQRHQQPTEGRHQRPTRGTGHHPPGTITAAVRKKREGQQQITVVNSPVNYVGRGVICGAG